ncbi:plasminogen activator [Pseudomonas sp. NFACC02]|uniref:omptin family outer membrane protease n=1 Tax=Pseudomonas sp. NFACC02 TaxID=1566250 RepID=UPI0008B41CC9|nr:omptin family outer membrane protease [Pseudomonas sp. NFACC02]SEP88202.1 plasminogen activator [Pseudomonas sp. NFACC02]
MKVRKTLALLGLVTVGQHAVAHAHTLDEQRFQLGGVDVSLGLGLLNGQAQEKVYDAYDGQKISQLNWDLKQVPTLHLGLIYHPLDWLSLEAKGWTKVAKGDGHLQDYDWMDDGGEGWTDFSDHPDTRVQKAWQAEVAATAWALKRGGLALGAMLGYQRNELGWQARGGRYVYSSDERFRDNAGEFPAGEKGITYRQSYATPYVGLVGVYHYRDWTVESRFKYSQWVKARDYDQHHMRDLTFAGNQGNSGRMQSLALAVSYDVNPKLSVKAGIDYQVYAEAKGSVVAKDLQSGERDYYGGDSGSQSSRTVVSNLAVAYRF